MRDSSERGLKGVGEFDAFFREEYPRLARALILTVGDPDLARELAQESCARLYVRWGQMMSPEHARNLMYRIGVNLARSHLRRTRRLSFVGLSRSAESHPMEFDTTAQVDTRLGITRALGQLSPRQRLSVVLVDYVGLDPRSAAEVLGTSRSTVYVHLSRARKSLRVLLTDQGEPTSSSGQRRKEVAR